MKINKYQKILKVSIIKVMNILTIMTKSRIIVIITMTVLNLIVFQKTKIFLKKKLQNLTSTKNFTMKNIIIKINP